MSEDENLPSILDNTTERPKEIEDTPNGPNVTEDEVEIKADTRFPTRPPRLKKKASFSEADLYSSHMNSHDAYAGQIKKTFNELQNSGSEGLSQVSPEKHNNSIQTNTIDGNTEDDESSVNFSDDQSSVNISDGQSSATISDDQSSASSTDRTAVEQDTEPDCKILYDRRSQSLSALDNKRTQPPKTRSKTYYAGSDYVRVYRGNHNVENEILESENIGGDNRMFGDAGIENIGGLDNADENVGGLNHGNEVQNQVLYDSTSEEDDVQVNVPVTSGVQHLHIHINLNFTHDNSQRRRRRFKVIPTNTEEERQWKRKTTTNKSNSSATKGLKKPESKAKTSKEVPDIPPKQPVALPKAVRVKSAENKEVKDSDNPTAKAPKTRKTTLSKTLSFLRKTPLSREKADYDEIMLKDGGEYELDSYNIVEPDEKQSFQSSSPSLQRIPQEPGSTPAWLFPYTKSSEAEEKINIAMNGSFVVIEENKETMPFTPYTLLVVHDGQLIRIPVSKHRLIQHRMIQTKEKYSLDASPNQKMKSIKGIVNFFQKHDIGGLKLRLKLPE